MMDLLVKYPSRTRPAIFHCQLARYLADPLARLLVTADLDDSTMNMPAMRMTHDRMHIRFGNSTSKIEAINDGVAEESWQGLLLLGADDMVPQRPDYARRIAELFAEHFPKGDGVLHLNDGRCGRNLNTLPMLDRRYFDRFGYVYNPAYTSLYADNEFQEVSERLGRAAYVDEVIIRHDWVGETCPDDLHRRNESFHHADGEVFARRKAAGFPPGSPSPLPRPLPPREKQRSEVRGQPERSELTSDL